MNSLFRTRRSVLVSGIAASIATRVGINPRAEAASRAPLSVRLTLDGKEYRFDEAAGRDLGDYAGPGFIQRCVMVVVPDLPLSVFLRPDRDSNRIEVVFELGRMWSGEPRHIGPYRVEIMRSGQLLANIDVPMHYWFSRWRWQSARRPITAKIPDLIKVGLLPPYALETDAHSAQRRATPAPKVAAPPGRSSHLPATSVVAGGLRRTAEGQIQVVSAHSTAPAPARPMPLTQAPPTVKHPYTIMGMAGLAAGMGTTGDRGDIGPVTEVQARWICSAAPDAFAEMLAQAEASGTVPWHMRDEKTGAPFNFEQYPKGGWNWDAPKAFSPYVKATLPCPVKPDWAHHPALTYVPFILTGDPYYLEELQLMLTWCIGGIPSEYRAAEKCILPHLQPRSYAWCLRDAVQLAKVTPERVPGWLLPQAYWGRILENNRVWFEETFVHNAEPPFPVFRVATHVSADQKGTPMLSPWAEDYLSIVLGWTALIYPAWRNAFVWRLGDTIARTDGKSGWGRAYASPYNFYLSAGPPPTPWAQNWREAWEINVRLQGWRVTDAGRFSQSNTGYLHYARAVLALATWFDVPEANDCHAWASTVIANSGNIPGMYRWRIRPRA